VNQILFGIPWQMPALHAAWTGTTGAKTGIRPGSSAAPTIALKLKLEGVKANRAALSARIKVVVTTADGEEAIRRPDATGAASAGSSFRQKIGLGQAKGILRSKSSGRPQAGCKPWKAGS
jgi:hypothetical protein